MRYSFVQPVAVGPVAVRCLPSPSDVGVPVCRNTTSRSPAFVPVLPFDGRLLGCALLRLFLDPLLGLRVTLDLALCVWVVDLPLFVAQLVRDAHVLCDRQCWQQSVRLIGSSISPSVSPTNQVYLPASDI